MRRAWLLVLSLVALTVALAAAPQAGAQGAAPVLHEPIPPDPREDVALSVPLDGELHAAIDTPRGPVAAPDPNKPPAPAGDAPYSSRPRDDVPDSTFDPDRHTQRPDVLPYDDPFSPSTAPFKRLSAFDRVDASYTLSVRDPSVRPLAIASSPPADPSEEKFYADMVVDLAGGQRVKIPSVGPDARVLAARAGVGTQDVRFRLYRDGADNWFIESETSTRARVVMELAIRRATFGGDFGSPSWAEMLPVAPLPPKIARSATEVAARIGVSRRQPPRDVVAKLVQYFRGFSESDEPPAQTTDIYLDLALSKKGVCRHRAFAFLVTALHLGLPTRMIVNEAHAWVEVWDGHMWRRIDLGGAGRTNHDPLSQNVPHDPPPDPFAWPQGARRGDDLGEQMRRGPNGALPPPGASASASGSAPPGATTAASASSSAFDPNAPPGSNGSASSATGASGGAGGLGGVGQAGRPASDHDDRPTSTITMTLASGDAHRGAPLHVRGTVVADGEPCGHVTLDVVLRSRAHGEVPLGVLATDERGAYDGSIVIPLALPLGDWDVAARTPGDQRCGRGASK